MASPASRPNRRRQQVIVTVTVLVLLVGLWAWWIPSDANHPPPASSKITVDKTTLTFDPGTCTEGHGTFYWSMGSCAVKVLHHEGDECVFEYTEEIEMGSSVYLMPTTY